MKIGFRLFICSCLILPSLLNNGFALIQQDVNFRAQGIVVYPIKILTADNVYGVYEDPWNVTKLSENLDLYVTMAWQGDVVDDLHSLKPSMMVLVYRNVRVIYKNHAPDEWELALQNNWPLRDENGEMIYCTKWPENYMMDIGSSSYQDFVVNWTKNTLDAYGFDGVLADYGLECGVPDWKMTSYPVNPRTGQLYTDDEWVNDLITLINKIKDAIASKLYVGNGVHNGPMWLWRRENYGKVLNQSRIDGFMSEGLFINGFPDNLNWYTEEQWRQSLDFLVWIQNNFLTSPNKLHMAWSYSSSDKETAFIVTSFLLGMNKSSQTYVSASYQMTSDFVKTLTQINVGVPVESYHAVEGTRVYERDFTKVKVLVNPTSTSFTTDLQGTFETLDGEVVTQITLQGHSGVIVKRILQ